MELAYKWSRLETLTALELHEIIKTRESVFVVEQKCAYQETDDFDLCSWHLSARCGGELAAYLRIIDPGAKFPEPRIGRVMILPKFRNHKLARPLMDEALRFIEQDFAGLNIKISAQLYLLNFYESLGFARMSEPYDDDGILHVDMIRLSSCQR